MSLFVKSISFLLLFAVLLTCVSSLVAQQEETTHESHFYETHPQEGAEIPFLYPDPKTVGVLPYMMRGKPAGAVTPDRYAGISEQERMERVRLEHCLECNGLEGLEQVPCPMCEHDPTTPCGECKMCVLGYPCERTICRHCVQPRSKNMMNSCDLTAGDEPCGTCDSCRSHRSDPCEHADTGYGPRGEYNPHKEPRFLSVIPRPILDTYNNGARKFPVYHNPAPYYRPTWNPSTFSAYARPYTHRWTCGLCFRDPCGCNTPGVAGQVSYAYACKFCRRNPCACTAEICDVNAPMDPAGIANALTAMREEAGGGTVQAEEIPDTSPTQSSPGRSSGRSAAPSTVPLPGGGGTQTESLLDDDSPIDSSPSPSRQRPVLDAPAP